jgi:hypothetical protein
LPQGRFLPVHPHVLAKLALAVGWLGCLRLLLPREKFVCGCIEQIRAKAGPAALERRHESIIFQISLIANDCRDRFRGRGVDHFRRAAASDGSKMYLSLKRMELERDKLQKWDGRFPTYFLGAGQSPDLLLQMPVAKD